MFGTEPAAFEDFGPSVFFSRRRRLASFDLPREGKAKRRLIRTAVPRSPGVYGMIDADGELIYVGKSKSLVHRLLSYFPARSSGEKSERIGRHARRLVYETAAHEFLALLRELELIRRFEPRFNVQGQPERQRPGYICLTAGPAPYFRVVNRPPAGCSTWFGPLHGVARYRPGVDELNRRFLLRDCSQRTPMMFAEQGELFSAHRKAGCLRYELGTCLGPCAALCTARDYSQAIERALAFLRGEDTSILERLEQDMREAARDQVFHRAAVLRDAWRPLMTIHRGLERLRALRDDFSFVYEVKCRDGERAWVLVRAGQAVAGRRKPRGRKSAQSMEQLLDNVYCSNTPAPLPEGDLDMLRLIGAWFHRREEERKRTHTPQEAARYCQSIARSATASASLNGHGSFAK